MNRFNQVPSAVSFFGRQTSEDDIEPPRTGAAFSKVSHGNQGEKPPAPSRSLSRLRNFSFSKSFSGIQRTISGFKIDNEEKKAAPPRLRNTMRSNSQSSNLEPPEPNANLRSSHSFEVPSAIPPRPSYPSRDVFVPEMKLMQPSRQHGGPNGALKKPPPPSSSDNFRVPPTVSPLSGRYGSQVVSSSQGFVRETRDRPMQKQSSFRRDVSVVEQRPQKPSRGASRSAMQQQHPHHRHQQQPHDSRSSYHQDRLRQYQGSSGRPAAQQSQSLYPHVGGNGQLSPSRAWNNQSNDTGALHQDDLYSKESYKNFDYSNAKKLKPPPPPSALRGGSSPASTSSRSSKEPVYMEIYPGVKEVLRGSVETSNAAECGFVVSCKCMSCGGKHVCIANAAYVICPNCQLISHVESNDSSEAYGLGLGFVPENDPSVAAAGFS